MDVSNLPLVLSSLTFLGPYFLAASEGLPSAVYWGALTVTSTLLHITKRPFHIYGAGNCIPELYTLDLIALHVTALGTLVEGIQVGLPGILLVAAVIAYATVHFHVGQAYSMLVYDPRPWVSILSHASVHLATSIGGLALLLLRR